MDQQEKEQLKKEILEELQGKKTEVKSKMDLKALIFTGIIALTFLVGVCVGAAQQENKKTKGYHCYQKQSSISQYENGTNAVDPQIIFVR